MSYSNAHQIFALIPAFNEEDTIADVVNEIKKNVNEVIVINDCSTDRTETLARECGALVISHTENKGYDEAINTGFKEASKLNAGIVFTFDADGQHQFKDIELLLLPIINNEADIVIGMRKKSSSFGEWCFSFYTNVRFKIKDPLCGLKAYRMAVYNHFGYFDTMQSIGTQLLLEASIEGYRIKAIPIQISERMDTSRFYVHKIKGNLKILKALTKMMLKLESSKRKI